MLYSWNYFYYYYNHIFDSIKIVILPSVKSNGKKLTVFPSTNKANVFRYLLERTTLCFSLSCRWNFLSKWYDSRFQWSVTFSYFVQVRIKKENRSADLKACCFLKPFSPRKPSIKNNKYHSKQQQCTKLINRNTSETVRRLFGDGACFSQFKVSVNCQTAKAP